MKSLELSRKRGPDCGTLVARVAAGLALLGTFGIARGQIEVVGWGEYVFNSAWNNGPSVAVAAGGVHTVSLRSDGSVVAWGDNTLRPMQRTFAAGGTLVRRGRRGLWAHGGAAQRRLGRRLG